MRVAEILFNFFGFCLTPSGPITWEHLMSRCGTGIRTVSGARFMPVSEASEAQTASSASPKTVQETPTHNIAESNTTETTARDTIINTPENTAPIAAAVTTSSVTSAAAIEAPDTTQVFETGLHMYHLFKDMEK